MNTDHDLPPGQRAAPLRPFGLPDGAAWQPEPGSRPEITVRGEVPTPLVVDVAELIKELGRTDVHSDLHCVATWSATDLHWSGLAFNVFWAWLGEQAELDNVTWLRFKGADSWSACLALEDALAADVLLADRLNGEPVPPEHGAPLRLVVPAQYGYKNVKNLRTITMLTEYRAGSSGWAEHPRARAAREERSPGLPGWIYRGIYGVLKPAVFAVYNRRRTLSHRGVDRAQ